MYFAKFIYQGTPKNSLQKYLAKTVQVCEKTDVDDPQTMQDFLTRHLILANQSYRRCTPMKLSRRGGTAEGIPKTEDITLAVDGLFEIRLYKKHGPFASLKLANSTQLINREPTQPSAQFTDQLGLF